MPPHLRPNQATAQILRRRFIVSDYTKWIDIPFVWDTESFCAFYGITPNENVDESIVNHIVTNGLNPQEYLCYREVHGRSLPTESSTTPLVVESQEIDTSTTDIFGMIFGTAGEIDPLRILQRIESHDPNQVQEHADDVLDPTKVTLLDDIYTILNQLYPPPEPKEISTVPDPVWSEEMPTE